LSKHSVAVEAATDAEEKNVFHPGEEMCHEPPIAESQDETDEPQWKTWMIRKFSMASSARSFHGTALNYFRVWLSSYIDANTLLNSVKLIFC